MRSSSRFSRAQAVDGDVIRIDAVGLKVQKHIVYKGMFMPTKKDELAACNNMVKVNSLGICEDSRE